MTNPTKSAMDVWREAKAAHGLKIWSYGRMTNKAEPAAATVIDQALQAARDEERAAVVAWLRKSSLATAKGIRHASPRNAGAMARTSGSIAWLADQLDRGEHRREG